MTVIIVTGAFGTLGRAIVADQIARGAKVAGIDIAPAPGNSRATLEIGGVDLAQPAAVEAAFAEVAQTLGTPDGLVNAAGGFTWELVAEGAIDSFERMFAMNLRTAAVASRAAVPLLRAPGGAIVNIGAFGALRAAAGMASYAASKSGVHALTESLAEELREKHVRVNAVLPTILDTPVNRKDMPDADPRAWVSPASAAKVIGFLLSPDAGAVTGALIPLSLGEA